MQRFAALSTGLPSGLLLVRAEAFANPGTATGASPEWSSRASRFDQQVAELPQNLPSA